MAGVMVGVEWNVLDMGRVRNRANALSDKAESVIRLRRDTQSLIALEVRQRWLELETARQRVIVARQTTAQADENLRVARDRYQHQVGTSTEVLDAERFGFRPTRTSTTARTRQCSPACDCGGRWDRCKCRFIGLGTLPACGRIVHDASCGEETILTPGASEGGKLFLCLHFGLV